MENTSVKKRDRILVYFLAAVEDQQECVLIKKYLTPVVRTASIPIDIHSDFDILAGEDTETHKMKLFEADIVIALISADFINDEEIYERTKKVISRYNNGETVLLPVLVRNCMWKSTPFINFKLLPKNIQPLNNKQFWNSDDDAITTVVTDISESINAFSQITGAYAIKPDEIKTSQETRPEKPVEGTARGAAGQEATAAQQQDSHPSMPRVKPSVRIDENWRTQYYRNVIWKRAAAFFIDFIMISLPVLIISVLIMAMNPPSGQGTGEYPGNSQAGYVDTYGQYVSIGNEIENNVDTTDYMYSGFYSFIFYVIVCAFMESSRWKGTFGKRIMKLQITDRDGSRISFWRSVWRNICRTIVCYSYIFIIPLIIQVFTFQKSKKLFHDQLSKTVIGERLVNA